MASRKDFEEKSREITIIDEHTIKDKIYEVRGTKVMLDFELAELYGYETKNFNRQVKNNSKKFEGDEFMFRLTREELDELVRCKKFTSRENTLFKGQGGGSRYLPNAFTEQGVYLLMTVLKGDIAIKQSRALVMAFKEMKDYIAGTKGIAIQQELISFLMRSSENTETIRSMRKMMEHQQRIILEHERKLEQAFERINQMVKKTDISPIMLSFDIAEDSKEFLLREGCPAKADATYIDIYGRAKKSIYIIDNYINIKTLRLLQEVEPGVEVTVFSDNLRNYLHASDYSDFRVEFPSIPITFISTGGILHDRFIVLDYAEEDERIFHCGSSSKDAAVKLTTAITEMMSDDIKRQIHLLIEEMEKNPQLTLK